MRHVIIFTLLGLTGWHAGEVYKARVIQGQASSGAKRPAKRQVTDSERRMMLIPKDLRA